MRNALTQGAKMARTAEEQLQWEMQAYGTTAENLDAELEEQKEWRLVDKNDAAEWTEERLMLAMSLLSDAQEQMGTDRARQTINVAKRLLAQLRREVPSKRNLWIQEQEKESN